MAGPAGRGRRRARGDLAATWASAGRGRATRRGGPPRRGYSSAHGIDPVPHRCRARRSSASSASSRARCSSASCSSSSAASWDRAATPSSAPCPSDPGPRFLRTPTAGLSLRQHGPAASRPVAAWADDRPRDTPRWDLTACSPPSTAPRWPRPRSRWRTTWPPWRRGSTRAACGTATTPLPTDGGLVDVRGRARGPERRAGAVRPAQQLRLRPRQRRQRQRGGPGPAVPPGHARRPHLGAADPVRRLGRGESTSTPSWPAARRRPRTPGRSARRPARPPTRCPSRRRTQRGAGHHRLHRLDPAVRGRHGRGDRHRRAPGRADRGHCRSSRCGAWPPTPTPPCERPRSGPSWPPGRPTPSPRRRPQRHQGRDAGPRRPAGLGRPLDPVLEASAVERPAFEAMQAAVDGSLPDFRRYLAAKAQALGKDRLAFWDLFAPVGDAPACRGPTPPPPWTGPSPATATTWRAWPAGPSTPPGSTPGPGPARSAAGSACTWATAPAASS